jgi:hypothetical protein
MTFSVRQMLAAVVVSFASGALVEPAGTQGKPSAAASPQPKFMVIEFMKIAPGKFGDWAALERDTWKPVHQRRVQEGAIVSWAALAQVMPGDESNGPIAAAVTTFSGWPDPTKDNYPALLAKVHPQRKADTIFTQAEDARRIVRQEIWHIIDETTPKP